MHCSKLSALIRTRVSPKRMLQDGAIQHAAEPELGGLEGVHVEDILGCGGDVGLEFRKLGKHKDVSFIVKEVTWQ